MSHTSSKLIELGSTAFRQPRAASHCKYIHGYQLKAEVTFACNELDSNNWVFDFGGLKDLKHIYKTQFDHTLVIANDDPEIELLKELNARGLAQLRIMTGGEELVTVTTEGDVHPEEPITTTSPPDPEPKQQAPVDNPRGAQVGPGKKGNNFSNPFEGTSWGV